MVLYEASEGHVVWDFISKFTTAIQKTGSLKGKESRGWKASEKEVGIIIASSKNINSRFESTQRIWSEDD